MVGCWPTTPDATEAKVELKLNVRPTAHFPPVENRKKKKTRKWPLSQPTAPARQCVV